MSPEALKAAQASAAKTGVTIKTVEAKHEDFDFGEGEWDLIVCSYNYMRPTDAKWPPVLYRALKKGGVVVYQSSYIRRTPVAEVAAVWKQFTLLRLEDVNVGAVDNDWGPSMENPTLKLVARKE
jgi:SAM-dependent methyltransferase